MVSTIDRITRAMARIGWRRVARAERRAGASVFLAAHVGAVIVLYAVALSLGGGTAVPPIPPDPPARIGSPVSPVAARPIRHPEPAPDRHDAVYSAPVEIEAPWRFDAHGRVYLRTAE